MARKKSCCFGRRRNRFKAFDAVDATSFQKLCLLVGFGSLSMTRLPSTSLRMFSRVSPSTTSSLDTFSSGEIDFTWRRGSTTAWPSSLTRFGKLSRGLAATRTIDRPRTEDHRCEARTRSASFDVASRPRTRPGHTGRRRRGRGVTMGTRDRDESAVYPLSISYKQPRPLVQSKSH